jgi:2-dehydro-3-deoxy-D-arabinonate dehydratase
MKLVKYRTASGEKGVGRIDDDRLIPLDLSGRQYNTLAEILEADNPWEVAEFLTDRRADPIPWINVRLLAPIDDQEVWAAGVTYTRSKTARMEESTAAASCYDRVYDAPRPELFFKASPHRVAGPDEPLRIRQDAQWSVPEPEFTLVLTTRLQIVGYTIGNDMSSRDIEGDNPLYLPQAKVYDACCGLGPCIVLAPAGALPSPEEVTIEMVVLRDGKAAFQGQTDLSKMARKPEHLVQWLARDNSFPTGAFLLTGTGIVPPNLFTLLPGDVVKITIEGVGTLSNPVIQG